ncbi:MAG TPA: F0F1 ATP synthase subunit delta [Candidatus Omnitrophota bacterium]|nr:F0F1 ATP synthase subunit delta [Candidatus Omnitrophota bacterium]HPD85138.1 F0F1 ATP synthase subunit delta [Candidatus Omnitrophota bacterium]HRZ04361.1 F0F1 ATP synthase subunit delta [Candidatus Omnitrophota bacterium]
MSGMMILQFLVLTFIVTGTIIFFLHRFLISSTDGAVRRLNTETEAVRAKQAELSRKIKEADEELAKRKKEAEDLTKKMLEEADTAARAEREKMIKKAREEGEEIISRAQGTRDKIRAEIQKEMTLKTIDFSAQILNSVLSDRARGTLNLYLVNEFIENLEKMDMAQVDKDVTTADITTAAEIDEATKQKLGKVIKGKLNRDITVNSTVDPAVTSGAVLRFGSLALDGSLQNMIREASEALKQKSEGE